MEGYCVKCKTTRHIANPMPFTMKNGREATRGQCTVCSTTMIKIGAKVNS